MIQLIINTRLEHEPKEAVTAYKMPTSGSSTTCVFNSLTHLG